MSTDVAGHYSHGVLRERLHAALAEDGVDPRHATIEALAPYDQFHGRGLEATVEMADALRSAPITFSTSAAVSAACALAARLVPRDRHDLTAEFCTSRAS